MPDDIMQILSYPLDSDRILRKRKSIRRQLLARTSVEYVGKRIAILGGSTTADVREILELFCLRRGSGRCSMSRAHARDECG